MAQRTQPARMEARSCHRCRAMPAAQPPWPSQSWMARRQPEHASPIRVRTDFNPLAVFAPAVRTDADGAAQVTVKLPDNLTRYRVMVVAVDASGRQFGTGESNLTGPPAADGAPLRAALPQLWRPLRAAGRAAEPDRRADDRGCGRAGHQPRADRRLRACASPCRPATGWKCASRLPP